MDANSLIENAFAELATRPGFTDRPGQRQVALLLADCIEGKMTAAIEAPTGLGKSLAALVPAIAHAKATGKRTVIATYTNVLAEQYWRQDLPLAMSLFEAGEQPVRAQFLIGRQRYACLQSVAEIAAESCFEFTAKAELGIETEFRQMVRLQAKERTQLWRDVSAPPVCPAKQCPRFLDCYYYRARRAAEKAHVVITNHSVVIQDALLHQASDDKLSMLGEYDFLIVDEAHDFLAAAQNGLEFEINESKIESMIGIAQRLHSALRPLAVQNGQVAEWMGAFLPMVDKLKQAEQRLAHFGAENEVAILQIAPTELIEHPGVKSRRVESQIPVAEVIASDIGDAVETWLRHVDKSAKAWQAGSEIMDSVANYQMFLREFAGGAKAFFKEGESEDMAAIAYGEGGRYRTPRLRKDLLDFRLPLQGLIWDKRPWACLSATLTLDGNFEFFTRTTGAEPTITEVLDSPFDFSHQAALYVPGKGRIPDPSVARKEGREEEYLQCVARELWQIIQASEGRTLALFASRKEMEAVFERMPKDDSLPILLQRGAGVAATGERFKKEIRSSLFALRSFWTGFDAPGETLFTVALVRVPFEVPFDPVALGRIAWLQRQGLDPFVHYTLPLAKMLMRQGAGRLIRRDSDRGVVALLDPRLRTKSYGEGIFENLPKGMRIFDDVYEAVANVQAPAGSLL